MKYDNRIKGWVTQAITKALFEDAGYMIIPYGIEEIYREFSLNADVKQIKSIPEAICKMPDFLLISPDKQRVRLLEVKYRNNWNEKVKNLMYAKLALQAKIYGEITLILYIGRPEKNYPTPKKTFFKVDDYIKVLNLVGLEDGSLVYEYTEHPKANTNINVLIQRSWDNLNIDNFEKIQNEFKELMGRTQEQTLSKLIPIIKTISLIPTSSNKNSQNRSVLNRNSRE